MVKKGNIVQYRERLDNTLVIVSMPKQGKLIQTKVYITDLHVKCNKVQCPWSYSDVMIKDNLRLFANNNLFSILN